MKRYVKFAVEFAAEVVNRIISDEKEWTHAGEESDYKRKYIFLTELAKIGLPEALIQIEVINIMVAGGDTTAALLSLLWWYLAKCPDIIQTLREELEPLGSRPPTGEEVKKLKYVRNVVNEGDKARCL